MDHLVHPLCQLWALQSSQTICTNLCDSSPLPLSLPHSEIIDWKQRDHFSVGKRKRPVHLHMPVTKTPSSRQLWSRAISKVGPIAGSRWLEEAAVGRHRRMLLWGDSDGAVVETGTSLECLGLAARTPFKFASGRQSVLSGTAFFCG